jgi:hypothetical protein
MYQNRVMLLNVDSGSPLRSIVRAEVHRFDDFGSNAVISLEFCRESVSVGSGSLQTGRFIQFYCSNTGRRNNQFAERFPAGITVESAETSDVNGLPAIEQDAAASALFRGSIQQTFAVDKLAIKEIERRITIEKVDRTTMFLRCKIGKVASNDKITVDVR